MIPTVVVRPRTLGLCEGAITVKVKPERLPDVWEHVSTRLPWVHYASLTVGAFNIIVRVRGESRKGLERLVEREVKKLSGVIDCKLLIVEEVTLGRWPSS